jgi:hypothetical protein
MYLEIKHWLQFIGHTTLACNCSCNADFVAGWPDEFVKKNEAPIILSKLKHKFYPGKSNQFIRITTVIKKTAQSKQSLNRQKSGHLAFNSFVSGMTAVRHRHQRQGDQMSLSEKIAQNVARHIFSTNYLFIHNINITM